MRKTLGQSLDTGEVRLALAKDVSHHGEHDVNPTELVAFVQFEGGLRDLYPFVSSLEDALTDLIEQHSAVFSESEADECRHVAAELDRLAGKFVQAASELRKSL